MQTKKSVSSLLLVLLIGASGGATALADVTVYATENPPSAPSNLVATHDLADVGTSSTFEIFINTDAVVYGLALDIFAEGSGIKLTDINLPNYSGPRWTQVLDGIVAPNGASIQGAFAYGGSAFGSVALNPADTAGDNGYHAVVGAYHFATVSYDVVGPGTTSIWFQLGELEVGLSPASNLRFGVGDSPLFVDSFSDNTYAGFRSQLPEVIINVPEPTGIVLICFGLVGILGPSCRRRR